MEDWTQANGLNGEASGCTTLRCRPAPATEEAESAIQLSVSLNGQWDSRHVVAVLDYYDNDAVSISAVVPSAGPMEGGVPISIHGGGFVDLGGAACIFTLNGNAGRLIIDAVVQSNALLTCTPSPADAAKAGNGLVQIGVVLNGDPATIRYGAIASARVFYFVALPSVRLLTLNPSGGPIRGGTTLVATGIGLRACGGTVCPARPICLFDLPSHGLVGASTRTVQVLGDVLDRVGEYALQCEVPPLGATTEDATGLPIAADALVATLRVALLGYLPREGEPTTLLSDEPTFTFYDAAVRHIHPSGGPRNGGTSITLSGRALSDKFRPNGFPAQHGSRRLFGDIFCVFLASPPPAYHSAATSATVAIARATAMDSDRLRCETPYAPAHALLDSDGVTPLYVEAALNGYLDEHTKSTVMHPPTFTYYLATVSRLSPLGGPTIGGTMLTIYGSNLANYVRSRGRARTRTRVRAPLTARASQPPARQPALARACGSRAPRVRLACASRAPRGTQSHCACSSC